MLYYCSFSPLCSMLTLCNPRPSPKKAKFVLSACVQGTMLIKIISRHWSVSILILALALVQVFTLSQLNGYCYLSGVLYASVNTQIACTSRYVSFFDTKFQAIVDMIDLSEWMWC